MSTTVDVFVPLADLPENPDRPDRSEGSRASDSSSPQKPDEASHVTRPAGFEAALSALALERATRLAGMSKTEIRTGRLLRRSLDARKGFPVGFRLQVELFKKNEVPGEGEVDTLSLGDKFPLSRERRLLPAERLSSARRVVVVGSGPAGTFAALRLAQAGAAVTVIEQGKPVQPRRRDLALLTRGQLIPDSNYCFGEGGAGTYSDGKLYTRSKDRPAVYEALCTLIESGAEPNIAVDSRPHIGSNRLPQILTAMQARLVALGVTYRFSEQVTDFLITENGALAGVRCASGREEIADAVVLAVGHSARSIYELCQRRGVELVAKPFAIGARVEHPQPFVDRAQYGRAAEHPALPAAFYQLAAQASGRGVYSFCMCPGGWVVPAATEPEGLCTNGMSLKRRDSPLANAALVVTVEPADYAAWQISPGDPLAGLAFQRAIERRAFAAGGGGFVAPAQRLRDFLAGRRSDALLPSTYRPRICPGELSALLPPFVAAALREGVQRFERTMPGFLSAEAQLVGVETRTSSPVRIVRDAGFMSPTLPGLLPIGEGAGYAGGIISAAIDGLRAADALIARFRG